MPKRRREVEGRVPQGSSRHRCSENEAVSERLAEDEGAGSEKLPDGNVAGTADFESGAVGFEIAGQ